MSKRLRVFLGAGHGIETEHKRVVMSNGVVFKEWIFNRCMAMHIIDILEEKIIEYHYRNDTTDYDLYERAKNVNSIIQTGRAVAKIRDNPYIYNDIFVSCHADFFTTSQPHGAAVFTTRKQNNSDIVAEYVINAMQDGGIKMRTQDDDGDKDFEADFTVIKEVDCKAILIEFGFMSNKIDVAKLCDYSYQRKLAECVVDGLMKYHENEIK